MRKILILIFMLSFALACDQPYEEVGGFKIGCPLENPDSAEKITNKETNQRNDVAREYRYKMDGFFDYAHVKTDEDFRIRGVIFEKEYVVNKRNIKTGKERIKTDFQDFHRSLTDRWGEPNDDHARFLLSNMASSDLSFLRQIVQQYIWIQPQNSPVARVALFTSSAEDSSLYIRGYDKSIHFYIAYLAEGVDEERIEKKEDKTLGF